MEKLELLWDNTTHFVSGVVRNVERTITNLFGSSNARQVKKLQGRVDAIGALEATYEKMTDEELRNQTQLFMQRLRNGETTDDILTEAFAVCREGGKRFLGMRHYDVQLVGGMVLHSGAVAEMVTGEGKTLVATLPAYLNALEDRGVHVVTVNDYLARRDMEWMAPLYMGLGLTVGNIQSNMPVLDRQKSYSCNITYGTNNEFGFDYLRDNMRPAARGDERFPSRLQQSQGKLAFAIIDEVDNILIDEARTPLIISGPAHTNPGRYAEANKIALQLKRDLHYQVNEKDHTATLTDEGVRHAEKLAGVESFYTPGNMEWPHLIDNALRAHSLYTCDVNYVVKDGQIVIVDEFTGRLMDGRQWSDGLHQAVEAKENVKIKEETQTLATITLQNYFKLYDKICGMTGTAMTEAEEFYKIYELDVVAIPTNKTMLRIAHPDIIYSSEKHKWSAVAEEVENYHMHDMVFMNNGDIYVGKLVSDDGDVVIKDSMDGKEHTLSQGKVKKIQRAGRPILVGTTTIEKSELLSELLTKRGIKHEVLNAKNHKREADIVAQAGRFGAVTIATNMAGRGTDIIMGGNPETMAWARLQDTYPTRLDVPQEEWDALVAEIDEEHRMAEMGKEVKAMGGLHVLGTERHDARRIDLQLRGRCGRQGDPGSSRFFLSLDDDLMRIFAGPFVKRVLEMGGFKDDVPIESKMVSRRIDSAQKKREEFNFEIRKSLLEYDEVMDEQRKRIYSFRQRILDGASCREIVQDMIREQIESNLATCLDDSFGYESFASSAANQLSVDSLDPKLFRKLSPDEAEKTAIDEAQRMAETLVVSQVEDHLPISEDESEWSWSALAHFANSRWDLKVNEHELKKVGRERVDEFLIDKARKALEKIDISHAEQMLHHNYGVRTAAAWLKAKFGIELDPESHSEASADEITELATDKAIEVYDRKEAEYPVMAGFYQFSTPGSGGAQPRLDREQLMDWAAQRFEDADMTASVIQDKQRQEIADLLIDKSLHHQQQAQTAIATLHEKLTELSQKGELPLKNANGAADSLASWFKDTLDYELDLEHVDRLEKDQLEDQLEAIVENHYHPEFRRMERMVLLEVVDSAWKDHLLAMDYLRSAVRNRGMAQLDPKVEYKREGMRMFEGLWSSIGERVTDLVFRMENMNADFVSHTLTETMAKPPTETRTIETRETYQDDTTQENQDAADTAGSKQKAETIRNRDNKVGRNDPCPCNSGKKYKNCCMRKAG
ncbi:preprotein translocase subunit SecA [Mariniblastus fucicola]|uniref:Protein translocase subunit SecA n=1 Tax=Mariniblastus fucicola TaxID=980251 RepID=A0A5B9PH26_9BACT|nr:preprotein translocase subunit SecA [Mariniblastus fucicola]QEG23916.1 preprotein translocase subunit SecA [Mariniblastus fucicola]